MKTKVIKYKSGLKLICTKDKSANKGVRLEFRFKGGLINDPKDKLGLSHFVEHTITLSNNEFSQEDKTNFKKYLYSHNAETTFYYIDLWTVISDEELQETFKTFCNWLTSFNLVDSEVENERKVIEQEFKKKRIDLQNEMDNLCLTTRFTKFKEYSHIRPLGTLECINNITLKDINNHIKNVFALNNCQVYVYSNKSVYKIKRLVKKYLIGKMQPNTDKKFLTELDMIAKPTKPNIYTSASPDGDRSKIRVSHLLYTTDVDGLNFYKARLLNYIFEFTAHSFFREKYGLTYVANNFFSVSETNNAMYIYYSLNINCDKDNVSKVLSLLPEYYNSLKDVNISDDIIKKAQTSFRRYSKASAEHSYIRKAENIANRYFYFDNFVSRKKRRQLESKSKKIKADDLKEFFKNVVKDKPYIYVVSNTEDKLPDYAKLCKDIKKGLSFLQK